MSSRLPFTTPDLAPRSKRRHVVTVLAGLLASITIIACEDALRPDPDPTPKTSPAPSQAPPSLPMAAVVANQGAAAQCPPISFVTGVNLANNPSFEVGPGRQTWPPGNSPVASAAFGWYMHSSNGGAPVSSELVATTVPGPGGLRMLHFVAGGVEGGVYQIIPKAPSKVMFSVWVKVTSGHIVIGANAMVNQTPYSWTTKTGEWEQLRLCTDGTFPTDYFAIYNWAALGGEFYIDRVEIKEIP